MSDDVSAGFAAILDGRTSLEETKDFLTRSVALMSDPAALAAGAQALRARMTPVRAAENAVDVCGTGGDAAHTLNISTAVAFVLAGAGATVAKHGNRAMSSKCGAADVLEALGVKLTGHAPTLEHCLAEAHIAFLFAQNHHPAMRHVAQARRELGFRTIFNLLGPLANPAGVKRQLLGVFAPEWTEPVARALMLLGAERAWVLHGAGGLDELAVDDGNIVVELYNGALSTERLDLRDGAGLDHSVASLRGGDAQENARALHALLDGTATNQAYRDAVLLNAAAALLVAGEAGDMREGWARARESIEGRAALAALNTLIAITQEAP
jgi:anthranilate phosphoribosyltransferase